MRAEAAIEIGCVFFQAIEIRREVNRGRYIDNILPIEWVRPTIGRSVIQPNVRQLSSRLGDRATDIRTGRQDVVRLVLQRRRTNRRLFDQAKSRHRVAFGSVRIAAAVNRCRNCASVL